MEPIIDFDSIAKSYCREQNLNIKKKLGAGAFGKAFLLNYNQVLKITTDPNEALMAAKQVIDRHPFINSIYNVEKPTNETFVILQDYAPILDMYEPAISHIAMLRNYLTHGRKEGFPTALTSQMNSLPDDVIKKLTPECLEVIEFLKGIPHDLNHAPGDNTKLDIKLDHIGISPSGRIVVYDVRDDTIDANMANQLLENYGIKYHRPLLNEDYQTSIPTDDILYEMRPSP